MKMISKSNQDKDGDTDDQQKNQQEGDSWVQRQLGTGTVGYRDKRVQMRQLGTGTNGYKWCDSRVQGQSGTSATIGYSDKRVQGCDKRVQRQSGTSATNGYSDKRVQGCDKRVQRQSGTSAK